MRAEVEQELAHVLLTELLAYQFASPVRWIETQDVILSEFNTERIVEIGPSPTLSGMAQRTLKAKYETYDAALSLQRQVLCYSKDTKEIYYTPDPEVEVTEAAPDAPAAAAASAPAPVAAAPVAAAAAAPAASGAPAAAVADAPVKALEIVHAITAHKLKKPLEQVPMDKAIKDLVNGKSTMQNEILGDLGKEFGSTPEKPEETPLNELAEQFQSSFSGQLGKHSSSLVSRTISSKMPGGFTLTTARKYLSDSYGLGPGRQDSVLLLAVVDEPKARLGSVPEAQTFLGACATKYAAFAGISLGSAGAGGAGGAGGAAASGAIAIDSAAFDELTKDQRYLVEQQLELFARYLKVDLRKGDKAFIAQKEATEILQAEIDLWVQEHGEFYASGIKPVFSPLKARVYDSYWNWARQDSLRMFYDIIFGRLSSVDREIVARCISIMNRTNPTLIDFMQYHIDHVPTHKGATYKLAQELGAQLLDNCKEALGADPVYKDVNYPAGPKVTINEKGDISYEEVPREGVRKLEQYVYEMAAGSEITKDPTAGTHLRAELSRVYAKIAETHQSVGKDLKVEELYKSLLAAIDAEETKAATGTNVSSKGMSPDTVPYLFMKKQIDGEFVFDREYTSLYLDGLEKAAKEGQTFAGKNVLLTGAGAGSIGADILQGLLSGGAKVVVTTSRYSREVTEYYQSLYAKFGAAGSTLIVVPFNAASQTDNQALVDYIYNDVKSGGLGWDLDVVVPFAAISELGIEVDGIASKSELAHRLMLTNVLRLMGLIKTKKQANGFDTRPAQVILPLSPNHGTFGNDGLYSESKIGLETLFNRWRSESWGQYLTICGTVIGWTRGTGLMSQNNVVTENIERYGIRTFSQKEMAFNILGLLNPAIVRLCQREPLSADLNGGFQNIKNLKDVVSQERAKIMESSELRKAVAIETALEHKVINGPDADLPFQKAYINPRANNTFNFPTLKAYGEIKEISPDLEGMLDLERVVVVTGFGEVGPWGNARTRWEMEAHGHFSLEGCVEMAWIMGLIKHHNGSGPLIKGRPYTGWVDTKSGEPVDDKDVKNKYEKYILEHAGIRLIEPEMFDGYDPKNKKLMQEVIIENDMESFEASKEQAESFRLDHGDKVEIFEIPETGEYTVRLLKGARIYVPKALKFDRLVAGQIPLGWDARRYGISEDTINQVDPLTLYVLVSTVEALISAGITDPYEFYKYVHVSEVGNASGSGVGGVTALRGMFKDRFLDKPVQNDILQESFINTMAAWVNMLLLSSSGPIRTPVGACATAIESVESGMELIQSGKAKIVVVGGSDDFQEEGSFEFGNMNATSNAEDELSKGRTPSEMSRPNTTTRSGFMESQGAGMQLLMNAKLALTMGVPIYGIVASTVTASDKIGRSVPAPGKGVVTNARENAKDLVFPYRKLDIKYRRRQLELRKSQIRSWVESELECLPEEFASLESPDFTEQEKTTFYKERTAQIQAEAYRQEREALNTWGNSFYQDDARISPLRGALASFGLTIDDLTVCSFHGTSTGANDKNESKAVNTMLNHLGRSKGNPVLGVFQKFLTGHPKGGAGAWMLNGALQILATGLVPGNRNADNIDQEFEQFDKIVYPSVTLQVPYVKAVSITSFGFGQKGAQAIIINPDYLFSIIDEHAYEAYRASVAVRYNRAYRYLHNAIATNTLVVPKDTPPYTEDQEANVYLNPLARVETDRHGKALIFKESMFEADPNRAEAHTESVLKQLADKTGAGANVGVDVESIGAIDLTNTTFLDRNFTEAEQKYCLAAPSPQASFVGTWSAKEAVFKSLGVKSQGGGAELKSIEVLRDAKGAPTVVLHGAAKAAADAAGVTKVNVSISHSDYQAVAVAVSDKA